MNDSTETIATPDGDTSAMVACDDKVGRDIRTDMLDCAMTQDERATAAGNMADLWQRLSSAEEAKRSALREHGARIKAIEVEIDEQAEALRSGVVRRDVEVETIRDFAAGEVREVRLDTNEVLVTRPMRDSERQQALDLPPLTDAERAEREAAIAEHVETAGVTECPPADEDTPRKRRRGGKAKPEATEDGWLGCE